MTQDEIIEMAQECGLVGMRPHLDGIYIESLVAFAKLVAEAEQDADSFCDSNCVWTDHHPDCKLAQPEQEPVADDIASILACREMLDAQPVPEVDRVIWPERTEQEPVAWLLTDKNINSLQVDSIQRLIDRAKHAHHIDLCVRINGQDEWVEADWLKHMIRVTPPQRKPLTKEEMFEAIRPLYSSEMSARIAVDHSEDEYRAIEAAHGIKEGA